MTTLKLNLFALFLFLIQVIVAQNNPFNLQKEEIKPVIDSIAAQLVSHYVFPEKAAPMVEAMNHSYNKGKYHQAKDVIIFAEMLTSDLRSVSKDKHIRVIFDPERIARQKTILTAQDSMLLAERKQVAMARNNHGFEEVKIIEGNIGYLRLKNFSDPNYGSETARAAMTFLSNSEAIIIDLRNNGGGSSEMVQLISSYFFGDEAVHLNSLYWRPADTTSQTWTIPEVKGQKNTSADLYILTSGRTFSAAEEFCYNLQNLNKAKVIGETTGGGAHPGENIPATDRFMVFVPSGRAINPITNSNWEEKGVIPDFETSEDQALILAKIKAFEDLNDKTTDPRALFFYDWTLEKLRAEYQEVKLEEAIMQSYTGKYGPRTISLENGQLYYQRDEGQKFALTPTSSTDFMIEGQERFRLKFIIEDNKVKALQGRYFGGRTDLTEKNQ